MTRFLLIAAPTVLFIGCAANHGIAPAPSRPVSISSQSVPKELQGAQSARDSIIAAPTLRLAWDRFGQCYGDDLVTIIYHSQDPTVALRNWEVFYIGRDDHVDFAPLPVCDFFVGQESNILTGEVAPQFK